MKMRLVPHEERLRCAQQAGGFKGFVMLRSSQQYVEKHQKRIKIPPE
jgi:hypothetical protein